jgi:hypothetical protein
MRIFAEDTSLTAQVSVRALSTTYFGTIHHQQNVVERGSVLYGKALRKLKRPPGRREGLVNIRSKSFDYAGDI